MTALITARSGPVRARVEAQIEHQWTCACGTRLTDRGWCDYQAFVRRVLDHTDQCIESDKGEA